MLEKDLDSLLQDAFSKGGEPKYVVVDGELIERINRTIHPPKVSFKELLKRRFPKQFRGER